MLQEGVASARDIDKALRLGLNHPMGPFELVDLVGLDTRLGVLEFLHKSLGEKYRPCPLLVQYVKAGRLGKKAGRGVYDYLLSGRCRWDRFSPPDRPAATSGRDWQSRPAAPLIAPAPSRAAPRSNRSR